MTTTPTIYEDKGEGDDDHADDLRRQRSKEPPWPLEGEVMKESRSHPPLHRDLKGREGRQEAETIGSASI